MRHKNNAVTILCKEIIQPLLKLQDTCVICMYIGVKNFKYKIGNNGRDFFKIHFIFKYLKNEFSLLVIFYQINITIMKNY